MPGAISQRNGVSSASCILQVLRQAQAKVISMSTDCRSSPYLCHKLELKGGCTPTILLLVEGCRAQQTSALRGSRTVGHCFKLFYYHQDAEELSHPLSSSHVVLGFVHA